MYQEIVPGGDDELFTVGSYLDARSRPLAVFTGHKLRQHPPRFGVCRMAVSKWDDELAEAGLRLLRELGFWGVSQVEFKRDPRDGRYCLMEVNARHWMWHSLSTVCGVEPLVRRLRGRDRAARSPRPDRSTGHAGCSPSPTPATPSARSARGERKLGPWLKTLPRRQAGRRAVAARIPMPGAMVVWRQLSRAVKRRLAREDAKL